MARWRVLIVVIVLLAPGCSLTRRRLLSPPHPLCWDGLPIKMLQDASCRPDGLCGWSCLPGRWEETC